MVGNIAYSINEEIQDKIRAFLSPLILEIKNRLPSFPVTKEALNKAPFGIMPALRHTLVKYGSLIAENSQLQPAAQPQPVLQKQSEQADQPNRRKPKEKEKENKERQKERQKRGKEVRAA